MLTNLLLLNELCNGWKMQTSGPKHNIPHRIMVLKQKLHTICHILKQVKENATNNHRHCFSSNLLMLFQMMCSVWLTVLHLKTLLLIGCEFSTANQEPTNKWFLMATQREKRSTPSERALKTGILFDLICHMTSSDL